MATRYVRASDALWRQTPGTVLVRLPDGRGSTLRGTGVTLWEELAQPRTIEELTDKLSSLFDDPDRAIQHDVREVMRTLIADGTVVRIS